MLAKRHVRFVLSIQVFPAQLELHKDLLFLDFYTFGSFYNGVYTNCNKNKICERGIFFIFFFWKNGSSVLSYAIVSAQKDSGTTFRSELSTFKAARKHHFLVFFTKLVHSPTRGCLESAERRKNYAFGRYG